MARQWKEVGSSRCRETFGGCFENFKEGDINALPAKPIRLIDERFE